MYARSLRFLLLFLCTLILPQGVRVEAASFLEPSPSLPLCGRAFSLNPHSAFPRVLRVGTRPLSAVVSERTGHAFISLSSQNGIAGGKGLTCRSSVTTVDATSGRFIRSVAVGAADPQAAVDDNDGRVFVVGLDESGALTPLKLALTVLSTDGKRLAAPRAFSPCPCAGGGMGGAQIRVDGTTHRVFVLTLESVVTFDALSGRRLATVPLDVNGAGGFQGFEVDGRHARVFTATGTGIAAIDARTGMPAQTKDLGEQERALALDERTGRVFVANMGGCRGGPVGPGNVTTLDAATGAKIRTVLSSCLGFDPLIVDEPAGRVLVGMSTMQGGKEAFAVLDALDGTLLRTFHSATLFRRAAVNARTGQIYASPDSLPIQIVDPHTWRVVGQIPVAASVMPPTIDARTQRLFVVDPYKGTLTIAQALS